MLMIYRYLTFSLANVNHADSIQEFVLGESKLCECGLDNEYLFVERWGRKTPIYLPYLLVDLWPF